VGFGHGGRRQKPGRGRHRRRHGRWCHGRV